MPGPTEVTTKKHRWNKMTYVPVAVLGYHEDGEPASFPIGEPVEGVNCMDCASPITPDNVDEECVAPHNGVE